MHWSFQCVGAYHQCIGGYHDLWRRGESLVHWGNTMSALGRTIIGNALVIPPMHCTHVTQGATFAAFTRNEVRRTHLVFQNKRFQGSYLKF